MRLTIPALVFAASAAVLAAPPTGPEPLTLELRDFAALPITGNVAGEGQVDGLLARVNSIREEPGGTGRLFVTDMNGPIYILDKKTKAFTPYLDFNGSGDRPGLFDRLIHDPGYGSGISQFQFDPDYARNGKFYTVHMENPALPGSQRPDTTRLPGIDVRAVGYDADCGRRALRARSPMKSVLIEWTDTQPSNATFEGTAREVLRVQLNTPHSSDGRGGLSIQPPGRGDPEWRVMYIGMRRRRFGRIADAGIRANPQRLDTLVGKILRIIPDRREHVATSTLSENGRYRIPNDNPFAAKPGAREGNLGVRPAQSASAELGRRSRRCPAAAPDRGFVGLRTWETVNIIRKGANYGYSQREGNQLLQPDNVIDGAARRRQDPGPDRRRRHRRDGRADLSGHSVRRTCRPAATRIGSGYVYTGRALPALRGKYIFTDISTGRSGTPTRKRCSRPTMAIRRRWRRCTR